MKKKVLVIVAHPDDEILGCGATIRKKVNQGWEAKVVFCTKGVAGRYGASMTVTAVNKEEDQRAHEMRQACQEVGFNEIISLDFPDNRLDTTSRMDIAQQLSPIIQDYQPNLVLTHHAGDYNWDHSIVFESTLMAARPNYPDFVPETIWTFEVLSSTERNWQSPHLAFHPNTYIDVEKTIDIKKRALQMYKSEYRNYPHPRSIEAIEYLSRKRGLEVGLKYAEAFHVIRCIEA